MYVFVQIIFFFFFFLLVLFPYDNLEFLNRFLCNLCLFPINNVERSLLLEAYYILEVKFKQFSLKHKQMMAILFPKIPK